MTTPKLSDSSLDVLLHYLKVVMFICVCISNPFLFALLALFPQVLVFLFAGPGVPAMQIPGDQVSAVAGTAWPFANCPTPTPNHDSVGGREMDTFPSLVGPACLDPAFTLMNIDEVRLRTSVH